MSKRTMPYSRANLGALLILLDGEESRAELNRGNRVNIYRIGHYLKAADYVEQCVSEGATPYVAFAANFNATRGMHKIAKRFGFPLDVKRGEWIIPGVCEVTSEDI